MKVGWLHDDPGYLGGAELTMREFAAAAPTDVEVVACPPREVVSGLDRYVVGNCMSYQPKEVPQHCIRYHHDLALAPADENLKALHVFTSPLHLSRYPKAITGARLIPPALDLDHFKVSNGRRRGAVCVGRMAYGKGLELLAEYEEQVDVYSSVPVASEGSAIYRGATDDPAKVLSRYERFVFLPTSIEPFGRAVVEAWAAGLELVVNKNVGSLHWIKNEPEKLLSAADDFWSLVCRS